MSTLNKQAIREQMLVPHTMKSLVVVVGEIKAFKLATVLHLLVVLLEMTVNMHKAQGIGVHQANKLMQVPE